MRTIRPLNVFALCSVALSLTACQTFADYVNAANTLDPECGKRVHVEVVPFVTPVGVFPMVKEATYDKACNLEQFTPSPANVIGAPAL